MDGFFEPKKSTVLAEKKVEARLALKFKEAGFVTEKFQSPNQRAVPDRILTGSYKTMAYCECKSSIGKVTPAQQRDHDRRRAMGFEVFIVNSYEGVDALVLTFGRMVEMNRQMYEFLQDEDITSSLPFDNQLGEF